MLESLRSISRQISAAARGRSMFHRFQMLRAEETAPTSEASNVRPVRLRELSRRSTLMAMEKPTSEYFVRSRAPRSGGSIEARPDRHSHCSSVHRPTRSSRPITPATEKLTSHSLGQAPANGTFFDLRISPSLLFHLERTAMFPSRPITMRMGKLTSLCSVRRLRLGSSRGRPERRRGSCSLV